MFFATWFAFLLFQFLLVFPAKTFVFTKSYKFLLIPIIFFTSLVALTPLLFTGNITGVQTGQVAVVQAGQAIFGFATIVLSLVISGIVLLVRKTFRAGGVEKKQFRVVLLGMIITFSLIITFNFILPAFFSNPKSNKKAIDIEGGFIPHYEISKGKEKIVSELHELADEADEILLATDPDREGEAIAWHIAEATKLKNPKRVTFHEITKEAVEEAVKHPRKIDMDLKEAQEARRVLDRLVGYDLSGIIWKKVRYGLSAGRVQSPALRIIMEREREIRNFKPETFWVISADVSGEKKTTFNVVCEEEPRDKKIFEKIVSEAEKAGKDKRWYVVDVKESDAKKSPRAPFITSTLQQAASSRLGFSPSRTMGIAQKLYESGFITYMRTDSTNHFSLYRFVGKSLCYFSS
jgi:5S rRNA maturation endonuclease (ribonuclease M5)